MAASLIEDRFGLDPEDVVNTVEGEVFVLRLVILLSALVEGGPRERAREEEVVYFVVDSLQKVLLLRDRVGGQMELAYCFARLGFSTWMHGRVLRWLLGEDGVKLKQVVLLDVGVRHNLLDEIAAEEQMSWPQVFWHPGAFDLTCKPCHLAA